MAYKKETKKEELNKTEVKEDIAKENEDLKKQLQKMQNQLNLLMAKTLQEQKPETNKKERNIKFINLTSGILVLRGSQIWTIEGQFKSKSFLEREARMILNNTPNAIHMGLVYISDSKFVEENDLQEVYRNLLNEKELKELLNKDFSTIIEVFKNSNDSQRNIILQMVKDKKISGDFVDANVLVEISKIVNQDLLNIEEIAL